jgi:hypothetical protein
MKNMLREMLEVRQEKPRVFQVLLLHNDRSQEVEIQEAEEVDFQTVREHLKHGGSVFITSKNSQKLNVPGEKKKAHCNTNEMKTVTFYFDHM